MVERIESYRFSKRFKKEYNTLSKEIQKAFDKKLVLFLENTTHPSLLEWNESMELNIDGKDL